MFSININNFSQAIYYLIFILKHSDPNKPAKANSWAEGFMMGLLYAGILTFNETWVGIAYAKEYIKEVN